MKTGGIPMSTDQRRKYDSDFKRQALQLVESSERTVSEIAENLGIRSDLLYRWRKEAMTRGELAFPGKGKEALTSQEKEIRELKKRLKDAEMERDILKKAMAIFSKAPK